MSYPKQSVRLKGKAYHDFRVRIIERAGCRCQNPLCGVADGDPPYPTLSVEHKIPRSRLRLDTDENCGCLCVQCNFRVKAGFLELVWKDGIVTEVYEREGTLKKWQRTF
jgi:hypothetical protein